MTLNYQENITTQYEFRKCGHTYFHGKELLTGEILYIILVQCQMIVPYPRSGIPSALFISLFLILKDILFMFPFGEKLMMHGHVTFPFCWRSRKLLLSRKRGAIYTRSTRGFSLKISKVLSVGGSSLKWSKSIERNSKKANEVC